MNPPAPVTRTTFMAGGRGPPPPGGPTPFPPPRRRVAPPPPRGPPPSKEVLRAGGLEDAPSRHGQHRRHDDEDRPRHSPRGSGHLGRRARPHPHPAQADAEKDPEQAGRDPGPVRRRS